MKKAIIIFGSFFSCLAVNAQSPQFAVVRPDGTTYICPTWDSAYNKAVDNDYIYFPGIVISGNITIAKKLTIIGTGHYPDSTICTGKTQISGNIYLDKKCTIEGIYISNSIVITNSTASGSSFIRVRCSSLFMGGTNDIYIDGSVIQYISGDNYPGNSCTTGSNVFIKNSIVSVIEKLFYSNIKNCLFEGNAFGTSYIRTTNTSFTNCFFRGSFAISWYFSNACFALEGNLCNNCINPIAAGQNNYSNNQSDTLLMNAPNGASFDYSQNYHLKPNSPYLTAGDDGTQIGIYGGTSPYKEGAVPGNPHIYFKQVSSTTTNNGQLQIQFKVRTGN